MCWVRFALLNHFFDVFCFVLLFSLSFDGDNKMQGTLSDTQVENVSRAVSMIARALQPTLLQPSSMADDADDSKLKEHSRCRRLVIISGSGTSGRLAFLISLEFNRLLQAQGLYPCFRHLIAGGDTALLKSVESAEDTSGEAVADLQRLIDSNPEPVGHVVYIGVTCGLSATYVGAQLEFCMAQHVKGRSMKATPRTFRTILLGFNPVDSVKPLRIANWNSTFSSVVQNLRQLANEEPEAAVIVNPCVGPEAICGSTRMKGGSATKFVLETMIAVAIASQASSTEGSDSGTATPGVKNTLRLFQLTAQSTYKSLLSPLHSVRTNNKEHGPAQQLSHFVEIVDAACRALRVEGGRVVYLGRGNKGALGMIDASECPPTYNASFEDIRGYVDGGWSSLYLTTGKASSSVTSARSDPAQVADEFATRIPISIDSFFDAEAAARRQHGTETQSKETIASLNGPLKATDLVVVLDSCLPPNERHGQDAFSFASSLVRRIAGEQLECQVGIIAVCEESDVEALAALAGVPGTSLRAAVTVPSLNLLKTATVGSEGGSQKVAATASGVASSGDGLLGDFAMKLALNALSTTAHVQKGTVFTNRMVNLRVSNVKLFHRAVGMVAQLGNQPTLAVRCIVTPTGPLSFASTHTQPVCAVFRPSVECRVFMLVCSALFALVQCRRPETLFFKQFTQSIVQLSCQKPSSKLTPETTFEQLHHIAQALYHWPCYFCLLGHGRKLIVGNQQA